MSVRRVLDWLILGVTISLLLTLLLLFVTGAGWGQGGVVGG